MMTGVGAAGVATTDMLLARRRARHHRLRPAGRAPSPAGPTSGRRRPRSPSGRTREASPARADEALAGADVFIGLSGPGRRHSRDGDRVDGRRRDRLRDGEPDARRSLPEEIEGSRPSSRPAAPTTRTRSTTCSRSRASSAARLDVRASTINEEMKLAAAEAIAGGRQARRARARST